MSGTMAFLRATADGISLALRIQPGAKRPGLAGLHGDELKVRIAAPPVDGAANEAVIRFIADLCQVPRSQVSIRSGLSSRSKVVLVTGVSVGPVGDRIAALLPGTV